MEYKVYRLEFHGAVHFGRQNLEEGEHTCHADTLFSALCQEALKIGAGTLQSFVQYAKEGKFLISDAFPYRQETLFLPKPMKRLEVKSRAGDSVIKKAYKKLKYIPMEQLPTYLSGEYDVLNAEKTDVLGHFEMKTSVALRGEEEPKPYRVGGYYFHPGNGLYVIAAYGEQGAKELAEELWKSLAVSGIGGKRASGMGRFTLQQNRLPEAFCRKLETGSRGQYMSLSVSLPREEEMERALEGASYLLCKRGGFVASDTYAPEQARKRDLYVFNAGSCFQARYEGDVYDVSGGYGTHPVYRYAKPLFVEVGV